MVLAESRAVNAEPRYTNLSTAARILNINKKTLTKTIRDGDLPCLRIGGQVLIPVSALEARFEGQEEGRDA
jgi:excisionase family DNA binding protein